MVQLLRGLGYLPDLPDANDHDAFDSSGHGRLKLVRKPTASLPDSASLREFTKTIDQGALGSCTCNAGVQLLRASEIKQQVVAGASLESAQEKTVFASRLFPYYLARAVDGQTADDSGTYIRNVFKVFNLFGFCPEEAWPYNDNSDPSQGPTPFSMHPPADAFRRAYDQRSTGNTNVVDYARITSTGALRVDDIKQAIVDGHLVEFGTDVSEKFCSDMSANNGKPIDPPKGLTIAGGHALCAGGYTKEGVLVLNSWGEEYGDGGWCLFSWDYLTWEDTTDLWIARKAPLIRVGG